MSVIKQAVLATGQRVTPFPDSAGDVTVVRMDFTISANVVAATDIIELGYLPAGCVPVDATLITDAAGAAAFDVGFMTGDVGSTDAARASGSELFAAAASGAVNRLSQASAFRITKSTADRSIGVKASANITAANQVLTLVLYYAARP